MRREGGATSAREDRRFMFLVGWGIHGRDFMAFLYIKKRVSGLAAAEICTCVTSISSQSMGLCFAHPSELPVPLALDLERARTSSGEAPARARERERRAHTGVLGGQRWGAHAREG